MTPDSPHEAHEHDDASAVDPVDERISAALDGAEPPDDGAADGTGLSSYEARARDLAAARDLLAAPPALLDDVTRRRLLRTALDAAPAHQPNRALWSRRLAVAAAILVVAVIGTSVFASLDHNSNPSSSRTNAASGTTAAIRKPAQASAPADLHEVSNPAVLLRKVEAALGISNSPSATTELEPHSTSSEYAAAGAPGARCLATLRLPAGSTRQLLGTATFHGDPAVIVVALDGSRTLIYVLATGDCRLLTSQFLRR